MTRLLSKGSFLCHMQSPRILPHTVFFICFPWLLASTLLCSWIGCEWVLIGALTGAAYYAHKTIQVGKWSQLVRARLEWEMKSDAFLDKGTVFLVVSHSLCQTPRRFSLGSFACILEHGRCSCISTCEKLIVGLTLG